MVLGGGGEGRRRGREKKAKIHYKEHVSISAAPTWQVPAATLPADGRAHLRQMLGTFSTTCPGVPRVVKTPLHASLCCIGCT